MINRELTTHKSKSFFLFGPRQTGKTTFIRERLKPTDLYINLLPHRTGLEYAKEPGRFREEVLAHLRTNKRPTIVVDEVQKVPGILDDVHALIEDHNLQFILTGSSARRLRRGASNLLAGRAYTYHLYSLTERELGDDFNLERALRIGCLPVLWDKEADEDPQQFLQAYSDTYLREEVANEGFVKDLAPFARFLDIVAANDGEVVNFSAIARDCGVSVKTTQSYFQILEDTFLAFRIDPWTRSARKRLVSHPRYFLFDPGVTNALAQTLGPKLPPMLRGRRFEQLVVTQALARAAYDRLNLSFHFWRTNTGQEVDLVVSRGLGVLAGIEIKSTAKLHPGDLNGLRAFLTDHQKAQGFVVGPFALRRELEGGLQAVPWREFLEKDFKLL
jgi:uncharacterized protein